MPHLSTGNNRKPNCRSLVWSQTLTGGGWFTVTQPSASERVSLGTVVSSLRKLRRRRRVYERYRRRRDHTADERRMQIVLERLTVKKNK